MPRLGAIGTLVRDTIHTPGSPEPMRDWGGISYSLAAFEAMRPPGWSVLPIVKVGADVRESAVELLSSLETLDSLRGVRAVPESNNRVEIRYDDEGGRRERLSGGVPGWTWDELAPLALSCDALYVNFIAGWELDLPCARALRRATASGGGAPLYCDLHSLLLGVAEEGLRVWRTPPQWREWAGSFDLLQINAEELETLARDADVDASGLASRLVAGRTRALFVTRGGEGVSWFATRGFRERGLESPVGRGGPGRAATRGSGGTGGGPGDVSATPGEPEEGFVAAAATGETVDPTGCGDVWGMACFAALLGGSRLDGAMELAHLLAGRNATRRGTSELAVALEEMLAEGGARWPT